MPHHQLTAKHKIGQPPGTLEYVGDHPEMEGSLRVIEFAADAYKEQATATMAACCEALPAGHVRWVNLCGLHRTDLIAQFGTAYHIHPLVLEDIANANQRPKLDAYDDYVYIVVKMLSWSDAEQRIESEQVSLVLTPDTVLSFQERAGDVFEPLRQRLRHARGRVRQNGADYLAYCMLDAIIDQYFVIAEHIGEVLEEFEEQVVGRPQPDVLQRIHHWRHAGILLRRSVWPLREVVTRFERLDPPLVQPSTAVYVRDLYDHTVQIIETMEAYRDMVGGMVDLYLSSVSFRMNEVMKVLTIIATIFIPLTFIAGIYGMNFKSMPELDWRWSYLVVWLVMLGVAGVMAGYFKRKGWW